MSDWILYTEQNLRNAFKEEVQIVEKRPSTIIFGRVYIIYEEKDLKRLPMLKADVLIDRNSEFEPVEVKFTQDIKPYKFEVIEK